MACLLRYGLAPLAGLVPAAIGALLGAAWLRLRPQLTLAPPPFAGEGPE